VDVEQRYCVQVDKIKRGYLESMGGHMVYHSATFEWPPRFAISKENATQVAMEGFLAPNRPSASIADANKLMRRLGERYIWIDSLCSDPMLVTISNVADNL
jgi:hypothetical protein